MSVVKISVHWSGNQVTCSYDQPEGLALRDRGWTTWIPENCLMNVMDVMAKVKSRFDRVGDEGEARYCTTISGITKVEKEDKKKKSFDFYRHTHNNPSPKS